MADSKGESSGLQQSVDRGHPMPRRASPETSVTLQNHRLGREASRKASLLDPSVRHTANSPRRDSSGESHDTGPSDPKTWFDRSNRNPTTTFDAGSMDVDPPFFQKETDSSNEERRDGRASVLSPALAYNQDVRHKASRRTQSSSADEFRGVIDDLTIENKRLKEELKRYKQFGSDMMRKEKLFEIKVHGLPGWRKRELEATLRDFAAGLQSESGSRESRESPSQHRKSARHGKHPYFSKHDSVYSSRSRPVDSAYASMSTGPSSNAPNSVVPSLGRPSMLSRTKSSQQKVENYLRDTPDGLFPRRLEMTEKEKKKLVVRRLEQLFTGKIRGKNIHRNQSMSSLDVAVPDSPGPPVMGPPRVPEANREAHIQQYFSQKKQHSRDNFSTSNSNGDQTESGGNGVGSRDGGGSNKSPPTPALPEQRPTRPLDLDPDRVQIPSENMKYIKHLGLVPTEFLAGKKAEHQDVSPDADGWVYLNLLCNLAQLHMVNVTPGFIRSAVTEKSTKFQLSPDGRKIRWRGGSVGTKFSSDSSVDNSQKSPSADETDGSNEGGQRKRLKTSATGPVSTPGGSSKGSKFKPQLSNSPHSFHYKPLFVHRSSSLDSSVVGTTSQPSDGGLDDSNLDQWDYSGSGSSKRKRRRCDGAIIYYHGAPFCTDLSGDLGEVSPTTYLQTSTAQEEHSIKSPPFFLVHRTMSGSSLPIRPLSDPRPLVAEALDVDLENPPTLVDDDDDSLNDGTAEFPWCDEPEQVQLHPIEPTLETCGLGGVMPEDHFAVIVTTRRTIAHAGAKKPAMPEGMADAIVSRLASMRTTSPLAPVHPMRIESPIETEYLKVRLRRMKPVPLPPAAMFLPPFSSDSSSVGSEDELDSFDEDMLGQDSSSGVLMSQLANPHHSDGYREHDGVMSSNSDDDDQLEIRKRPISRGSAGSRKSQHQEVLPVGSLQSSVATAGGVESGYNSSMEED